MTLDALFSQRSIAVVGDSHSEGNVGKSIFLNSSYKYITS